MAGTVIDGNTIEGASTGIDVRGASPSITGNEVRDAFSFGILILSESSPQITGGNVITGNSTGIRVQGGGSAATNPNPVVNGNEIFENSHNYDALVFGSTAATIVLNAEGNYWGTTDPAEIATKIFDATDGSSRPVVDFTPFLDEAGAVVPGQFLNGPITDGDVLTDIEEHSVVGTIRVPSGSTLTIEPGAVLRFLPDTELVVDGTLLVQGTELEHVTFTSSKATPAWGDWAGIVVQASSVGTTIDSAVIEYATVGLDVLGAPVDVTNNLVSEFSSIGIRYQSGASGTISENTIDNSTGSRAGNGITVLSEAAPMVAMNTIIGVSNGIFIESASPVLTANTIQQNGVGISVRHGSSPSVTDGNVITANEIGIQLQSNGVAGGSPTPSIEGNQIFSNITANLQLSQFNEADTAIPVDARGNWWGDTNPAVIAATISTLGTLLIPVDFSDFLDGPNGEPMPGSYFSTLVANITRSDDVLQPALGESVDIGFVTFLPSTAVTLIICEDADTACANPVRQITQIFASPGPQILTWDGRTDQAGFASDEAYAYRLAATDGILTTLFAPPLGSGGVTGGVSTPPSVDFFRNEYLKIAVTLNKPGRVDLRITPSGGTPFFVFENVLRSSGLNRFVWDGRDPVGQIVEGDFSYFVTDPAGIHSNAVIVEGTRPSITGTGAIPNIEVKSDPYLVYQTYEQVSRIVYRLDQDAFVTVKLLPPGVSDPASPQAIVLVDDEFQAAQSGGAAVDHTAEWRGYAESDPAHLFTAEEGVFTFAIQARSAATDFTSLYRGVLQVRQ